MVAFLLHRLSGLVLAAFAGLHVLGIWLVGANPDLYDALVAFYAGAPGRALALLIGAALLYHSLNGVRIVAMDVWPPLTAHQRRLSLGVWLVFALVGVPGAVLILRPLVGA